MLLGKQVDKVYMFHTIVPGTYYPCSLQLSACRAIVKVLHVYLSSTRVTKSYLLALSTTPAACSCQRVSCDREGSTRIPGIPVAL